jgi:hypothetical protein
MAKIKILGVIKSYEIIYYIIRRRQLVALEREVYMLQSEHRRLGKVRKYFSL